MIGPSGPVRISLACTPTDMRTGFGGLAAAAQEGLKPDPCSGAIFVFRGKRADRVKLARWDGRGLRLFYKCLERGRLPWPSSADGAALRAGILACPELIMPGECLPGVWTRSGD